MSHELPGNLWVDYFTHNTRQASAALRSNAIEGSERLSQEALGNATLALAYEQRTANLIAVATAVSDNGVYHLDPALIGAAQEQIASRLGLGDK